MLDRDKLNELSKEIFEAALTVHREMGPGLLESVYQQCLLKEFTLRNINTEQMVMIPLRYKGTELDKCYIVDILVESEIIIELKAHEAILPVHEAQLISYLKLANKRLGFLINFNVPLLKKWI